MFVNKEKRIVFLLLLLILLSRLLLVAAAVRLGGDDGNRYMLEALNLYKHNSFSDRPDAVPTFQDLPVYPAVLAIFIAGFGSVASAALAASMVNAFLLAMVCFLVYGILAAMGASYRSRLMAMIIPAVSPESLPYSVVHMPDTLFVCLLLTVIYLLLSAMKQRSNAAVLASFGVLGFCCLVKLIGLFFGIVLVALLALHRYLHHEAEWPGIPVCVLGFMIQAIIISPWIARNYRQFGRLELTTVIGARLNGMAKTVRTARGDTAAPQGSTPNNLPGMALPARRLMMELRESPTAYLKAMMLRHPRLYMGTGSIALLRMLGYDDGLGRLNPETIRQMLRQPLLLTIQALSWAVQAIIYIVVAAGLLNFFRQRNWLPLALATMTIFYFVVLIGPQTSTRYRMPMTPFFAILVAGARPQRTLES